MSFVSTLLLGLRTRIALVVVAYMLVGALSQAFPIGAGLLVNIYSGPELYHGRAFIEVTLVTLAAVLCRQVLYGVTMVAASRLAQTVVRRLRESLIYSSFTRQGDVGSKQSHDGGASNLTLQTYDVVVVEDFLEDATERLLDLVFSCLTAAVALFVLGPLIGVVAMLPLVIVFFLVAVGRQRVARAAERSRNSQGALIDAVGDHAEIASSAESQLLQGWSADRFKEYNAKAARSSFASQHVATVYSLAVKSAGLIAVFLVLVVAGSQVQSGTAQPGLIVSSVLLARRFFEPVQGLLQYDATWMRARSSFRSLMELGSLAGTDPSSEVRALQKRVRSARTLTVRNLKFSYGGTSIFDSVSLVVKRGEIIAIAGRSGEGKSTLARVIAGVLPQDEGEILLNGKTVRQIARQGAVLIASPSTPWLPGSISSNLIVERPLSAEELEFAFSASSLDEQIRGIGATRHTKMEDLTAEQLRTLTPFLALARASVSPRPVLILDEVAAGIAFEVESKTMGAIRSTLSKRICIVISHRESTQRFASRRYLLEGGKLKAQKTKRFSATLR